ncbi:hypothetical protein CI238_07530 [Colletotrichum incanum]|uniref:Uncharacterized protein n=1 Tax=Colletotrichum incanum TaxID=1573173 RepID=A0A166ZSH9_COLIC|nr:hypothetical protein CI238_07530 [Colletotrichum incanum]
MFLKHERYLIEEDIIISPLTKYARPDWPELEVNLYTLFRQQQDKSAIVITGWFTRWFALFCCRWNILLRPKDGW